MTHVIAGGIGTRARSLCNELSIEVIAGVPSDEPGFWRCVTWKELSKLPHMGVSTTDRSSRF